MAYGQGQMERTFELWGSQSEKPVNPTDLTMIAEALAWAGVPEGRPTIDRLARLSPTMAKAVRSVWLVKTGDRAAGARLAIEALTDYRSDPWPLRKLMSRMLGMCEELAIHDPAFAKTLYDVLGEPFAAGVLGYRRKVARLAVGLSPGFAVSCVDVLAPFEPNVPWQGPGLRARAECYRKHDHPLVDTAVDDLATFTALAAPELLTGP